MEVERDEGSSSANRPSLDSIWVEKYRPKELADVIAHEHIMSTLTGLIQEHRLPHMLFYGPPGTGKTSTILAVARRLFGPKFRSLILELNASDDRGIDVVREQIKNFAGTRKIFSSGVKLIILDEADSMTKDAQAALRRVIEKHSKTTRFCLICNYINKIIPAIQSRCTKFRFAPLSDKQILPRLQYIIECENVKVTDEGLAGLLRQGSGDMRKCVNILQATKMAYDAVTEESVYKCTGNPPPAVINQIVEILFNEDFASAYQQIISLQSSVGVALPDIISEVYIELKKMQLPPKVRMSLFDALATIEYQQSCGAADTVQVAALVGAFLIGREGIEKAVVDAEMKEDDKEIEIG